MNKMQRSRLRAAGILKSTFEHFKEDADVGERLVAAYLETGKGDEYDIASNIIDAAADLLYAAGQDGRDTTAIVAAARRGEAADDVSEIILALRGAYNENARGYTEDLSFDDLVRIAGDHNGVELPNLDVEEYQAAGYK